MTAVVEVVVVLMEHNNQLMTASKDLFLFQWCRMCLCVCGLDD